MSFGAKGSKEFLNSFPGGVEICLGTWELLAKHIKFEGILMATLLALPLRYFQRKDFYQTWSSRGLKENGHFSHGALSGEFKPKISFCE